MHIYPVDGPDVRRAKALARGHTRSGKAELWTWNLPSTLAAAQVVKRNLKQIGLDVDIKGLPVRAYFREVAAPGASVDIALGVWIPDYVDPSQYIDPLFDGRYIGEVNIAHFNSPKYNGMIRRAARLQGDARYRAYGQLDVQLTRDAAPMAAVAVETDAVLVSGRVGCVLVRPGLRFEPDGRLPQVAGSGGTCTVTQTRPSPTAIPDGGVPDLDLLHDVAADRIDTRDGSAFGRHPDGAVPVRHRGLSGATSIVSVEGNAASSRSIRVTVPSSLLATQIAFAPNAMAAGPCPTVIGGSDPSWNVAGLKRLTVWSALLATHRR